MKRRIVFTLLAVFILAAVASAQEDEDIRNVPLDEGIHRRVEMFWMWRMTEVLELDEETAARLFPAIQRYERQIRQIQRETADVMLNLRRTTTRGETLPKSQVLEMTGLLFETQRRVASLRQEQLQAVSEVLTDQQFQRFVLAQGDIRRELHRMIRDSRGRPRDGSGHGRRWNGPPAPPPDE